MADWLAESRTEAAADRILDAADALFASHDAASVGMNDIAKASGCSRATLYRLIKDGRLSIRKCGARTLILTEDLAACIRAMPVGEYPEDVTEC